MDQDVLSEIKAKLEANRLSHNEIYHVLTLARPLYDTQAKFKMEPANGIASDGLVPGIRAALDDAAVCDWRIVVAEPDLARPERHPFMDDDSYAAHVKRCRDSEQMALIESCEHNVVEMLHRRLPNGMLLPTGNALPAIIEWRRNEAVGRCISAHPPADVIRTVLVATYLDMCLHGNPVWRARFRRIADDAARRAIPYGPRKQGSDPRRSFLCIGA